eukprot:TRINITY_DN10999_c0_g2_i2.p1 TRINITY_DN10999_c0_g2~~TRINITY_DN10999_c0_g2_i2.p1  ORF type:complete len:834 (+),score=281.02 TRINITY_DN10999_c0_g2_i2:96-2597(+)
MRAAAAGAGPRAPSALAAAAEALLRHSPLLVPPPAQPRRARRLGCGLPPRQLLLPRPPLPHPRSAQRRLASAAAAMHAAGSPEPEAHPQRLEEPLGAPRTGGRYGFSGGTIKTFYEVPDFSTEDAARAHTRKPFMLPTAVRASINRSRHRLGLPQVTNWKLFTSEAVRVHDEWCGIDDPRAQQQIERERKSKLGSSTSSRRGPSNKQTGLQKPFQHLAQGSAVTRPAPAAHPMSRVVGYNQYKDAMGVAELVNESNRESVVRGLRAVGKPVSSAADIKYLPRSPIVTVMGHVDHGKTTLLDCLRRSNVAASEAGGITQSIGAFRVPVPGADVPITFIDTPGHAAFHSMRRAGVNATDIVVLVVSAVEGVQPQTVEVIELIKEANIPCVVALTKADRLHRTGETEEETAVRVGAQLQQHELDIEAMGGDVIAVSVSALKGTGVDALLEGITLQAEMLELRTPVPCRAEAFVMEASSKCDPEDASGMNGATRKGSLVHCIVKRGVLTTGMNIVGGQYFVKVQHMYDEGGNEIKEAGPSQPVAIAGFGHNIPAPNSILCEAGRRITADEWGRFYAHFTHAQLNGEEWYEIMKREKRLNIWEPRSDIADEALHRGQRRDNTPQLRLILKAGTRGMLDAMEQAVSEVPTEPVRDYLAMRVVHKGVGDINDNDAQIFSQHPNHSLVLGCGVQNTSLAAWGDTEPAMVNVIYQLADHIKAKMMDFVPERTEDQELGSGRCLNVFKFSGVKTSNVGGLRITSGQLTISQAVKVERDGKEVYRAPVGCVISLRHVKEEVQIMEAGNECGIILKDFVFEPGDIITQIKEVQVKPSPEEIFGTS